LIGYQVLGYQVCLDDQRWWSAISKITDFPPSNVFLVFLGLIELNVKLEEDVSNGYRKRPSGCFREAYPSVNPFNVRAFLVGWGEIDSRVQNDEDSFGIEVLFPKVLTLLSPYAADNTLT
jgi:hypothetical protein